MSEDYAALLESKRHRGSESGIAPTYLPTRLFDFQRDLTTWALRRGRAALFADCGMGKTAMQLVWAENVAAHTGRPVLILTPLAVAPQTIAEGEKCGVSVLRSRDGSVPGPLVVTNYERLHLFRPEDFAGVVCDESSILKSFDGATRHLVTDFLRKMPYRLLATATAAPNDYIELGTSSEALGELGAMDMLNRFFKNDLNNSSTRRMYGEAPKWRFKGHAETPFWRWVASWARACRTPHDLGYQDGGFHLPLLIEREHVVTAETLADGHLFAMPAATLPEQREERRRTIRERCDQAAALVADDQPAVIWCHMNDEGDLLEQMIPGSVQVAGKHSDEAKEERFDDFARGQTRVLITKPKIGAWGLNWQHCAHVVYFPSHSYESYYQAVRRCWRFGQTRDVVVDLVMTEGERLVMQNLRRKAGQADRMFSALVAEMTRAEGLAPRKPYPHTAEVPSWLSLTSA